MFKDAYRVAVGFLCGWLLNLANIAWEDTWNRIFELVVEAEKKWVEGGMGEEKKKWVLEMLEYWVKERLGLGPTKRMLLRVVAGYIIDALIHQLNDTLGRDWIGRAKEIERDLATLLPGIE